MNVAQRPSSNSLNSVPELVYPPNKTAQPYSAYDEDTDDETPSSPVDEPISSPVKVISAVNLNALFSFDLDLIGELK